MRTDVLMDGPRQARATLLLAHGAGAPMDSAAMTAIAQALGACQFRVVRFEFSYMAARRTGGSKRPPPRADKLIPEYRAMVERLETPGPLIIGGKSMGGRVASMIADDLFAGGRIAGALGLGYPFHPPGKPETLRTAHLVDLRTPMLVCQGTRDPFGTAEEVAGYDLSPQLRLLWLEDGDHDLKPRKRLSGFSYQDHLGTMATEVSDWITGLGI